MYWHMDVAPSSAGFSKMTLGHCHFRLYLFEPGNRVFEVRKGLKHAHARIPCGYGNNGYAWIGFMHTDGAAVFGNFVGPTAFVCMSAGLSAVS